MFRFSEKGGIKIKLLLIELLLSSTTRNGMENQVYKKFITNVKTKFKTRKLGYQMI